ncbi:Hemolysin-type calcium-binding repeat-containing protein [Selenomonas ruminantium]|uniref:Hemolysin-type calcium-binding repeat-containing protein n=1 Tax=Selenomonas ruminantium TaxID=971 RepID=A0A1I3EG34_SELRU|nr:Hemolysin-type calcium-binding repeat-containing protein [Selenomonas ruminantium]
MKGLTDLTAAKNIKLISGNTTTTLSTLGSPLPVGLSYNKDKTVLIVSSAYAQDILNTADYSATIKTINAQNAFNITISGNSNANTIYGGAGNDTIYGMAGNDSIYGGKGDDILRGGTGNDVFYYAKGDGNDIIEGFEAGKDKIRYTSGSLSKAKIGITDVSLYNGNGCQILTKMSQKGQYADIIGTDGKTTRHNFGSYTANNTWNYIAGQGFHGGKAKIDTLTVTGGKSYNINLADASHYTSIDKVDASKATAAMTITGGEEANTLIGGNKNDLIKGGAGNDSLYGGKGNDTLYGGSGNDTFYYAQNDGNDTIADFAAGTDKIRYTSGSLSKVLISGNDVLLYNGTGYQKLSGKAVKGQYADIIGTNGKSVRHNFGKNATANNWNYSAGQGYHGSTKTDTLIVTSITSYNINLSNASLYTSIDNVDASESTAAMTITGSSSANTIEGSKKSDLIKGGAGNDTIKGGAGDDTLYGNAGKDVLYGGKGKDILYGGTENDTLHGGKGNDTLYGETGNDTLYGGKGNDILYGGAGNDVFYYARDDGNDTIKDFEAGKDKIRYTSGKLDQVKLVGKDVLLYNDIGYQKLIGKATKGQYADIIGTNGISVRHNFGTNAMANNWNYTAGQGYHGSSKIDTLTITGTKSQSINLANQSLYTSIDNVNASKAKVDMTIRGTASANTLIGGAGDDTLIGGAGNDNLQGGSGDDELYAQSGNNTLYGGAGDDTLKGGTGTDILRGNTGNDIIFGGKGVDKIQYYKGDGNDIIIGANKKDVLYLYNISNIKTQAKFTLVGNSLVMNFTNNKNDTITLSYWSTTGMNNFVVGGKTYHLNQTNGKISVK